MLIAFVDHPDSNVNSNVYHPSISVVADPESNMDPPSFNTINAIDRESKTLDEVLNSMPPGYKFLPHDDELIKYYLQPKIAGHPIIGGRIHDVDVYKHSPQHLHDTYKRKGEKVTYFFTPRKRKYANGSRPDRAVVDSGFWRANGKDHPIRSDDGTIIGYKKTLVFRQGKPKAGIKTNWIMQEFILKEKNLLSSTKAPLPQMQLDNWVLCKIYKNNRENESQSREESVALQVQLNEATIVPTEVNTTPQVQQNQVVSPNEAFVELQLQPNQILQDEHIVQDPIISECTVYPIEYDPSLWVKVMNNTYDPPGPSSRD